MIEQEVLKEIRDLLKELRDYVKPPMRTIYGTAYEGAHNCVLMENSTVCICKICGAPMDSVY